MSSTRSKAAFFKHDDVSLEDSKSLLRLINGGQFQSSTAEAHAVLAKLLSKFKSTQGHGQLEIRAILGSFTSYIKRNLGYRMEMTTFAAVVTGHLTKDIIAELISAAGADTAAGHQGLRRSE